MLAIYLFLCIFCHACIAVGDELPTVLSPDERLRVTVWTGPSGTLQYSISKDGQLVVDSATLGIVGGDSLLGIRMTNVSPPERVTDAYEMLTAKRRLNTYSANRRVLRLRDRDDRGYDLIFQVSNDGVAFRYFFPNPDGRHIVIQEELTSFRFPDHAKAWLQPMAAAKSGWEQTNPSYEEHYEQGVSADRPTPSAAGWVYPALFQVDTTWLLITEAALDGKYCATRLVEGRAKGEYQIGFPDPREVMPDGGLLPESTEPFYSPWRIIAVGSLATIAESNLGLDVAEKAIPMESSVVKPGKSSWSWINSKDDYIIYEEQQKYIDFAAEMKWQYCLIDVNWDRKIGYERMKELADYAAGKNVGLLLWYNSAGSWNTVQYTPKDKLLTRESRNDEFARIKAMGIQGVKIDFFGGDGRSVIQYYIDILEDAAKHGLLVNFHGATLPRGWSRTYPHLMTVEAVRGFEMVTFMQEDADRQASHATILPFTRNAFDPMDYTPMNLSKVRTQVQRRTTPAFELATSVVFISGIQHYAESPEGMANVPEGVKEMLRALPDSWDDVRFIHGFPGRDVTIARKAGNRWYVAGINGEAEDKVLKVDISAFGEITNAVLITDGQESGTFTQTTLSVGTVSVHVKPNGGFVMILE